VEQAATKTINKHAEYKTDFFMVGIFSSSIYFLTTSITSRAGMPDRS
jgi:hypothetical protein